MLYEFGNRRKFTLSDDANFYKKVIPENELAADLDDECKFNPFLSPLEIHQPFIILVLYLNYYLNTTQAESRRRRNNDDGVFDDISLNNKPQLQFSCKYDRDVEVNSELTISSTSTQTEQGFSKTGFLQYEATVKDVKIGRDSFTEILITPKHNLSNIYAV